MTDLIKRNPDHPVTQAMDGQWAKIVALLMYRDGVTATTIPPDVVERASNDPRGLNVAITLSDERGIVLLLLDNDAAEQVAKAAGGT